MSAGIHPLASVIAAVARGISGVQVRWAGCRPEVKQRIYFANHTSHLDFVVLWSALPSEVRKQTRPVAAQDYWEKGVKAYLAQKVFRAVLVHRGGNREEARAAACTVIDRLAEAMGDTESLILFPEGTRGTGETIAPFRSGLYYLAKRRPEVELVPAYLENLNRILPKGEVLPVPLVSLLTFGVPLHVGETEDKRGFLERASAALCTLRRKGES
ncbi:MAG: 1-acyl-sn-glycerol-3-phosphate acyltransferase [Acidobacteria bacterium]|nr:MAG: 1-acyl-sn-glycerol-3-phosphate acyltransferase [Acidobacteriota bacterium]